ncbi:formate dehydrogenase accessory sulfurtransferase FdhD [Aeromonas sp. AE23HZ002T15]
MDPHNSWLPRMDELVEEAAISININGISHAVMMATPDDLDDFAIGFLYGEGIIGGNHDVHDIQLVPSEQGMVLDVTIANRCLAELSRRKRRLTGASGCGICGVEAIEHALPALTPLTPSAPPAAGSLLNLRERIAPWQSKARQSGGLHAALALGEEGEILACREDIGRHNALDKLIGMQLRQPDRCHTLVITSRCGSELIHKAVQFGAAHLISLASPSQLAVRLALKYHLNLIHVPRSDAPVYYSAWDQIGERNVQPY